MKRPLILVGASGLAREVAEAACASDRSVVGCVDDDPRLWGTVVGDGLPVLGGIDLAAERSDTEVVLCTGKGETRRDLEHRLRALGLDDERYATVVHPAAEVPPSCAVGPGSVMLAGTVLTASVFVCRHVVCMANVTLTHDDVLEDFATLCAGVVLGGSVRVGVAAYIGMAASVRERTRVGVGAVVGMGAVVLDDVPDGETWVGVPARRLHAAPFVRLTSDLLREPARDS